MISKIRSWIFNRSIEKKFSDWHLNVLTSAHNGKIWICLDSGIRPVFLGRRYVKTPDKDEIVDGKELGKRHGSAILICANPISISAFIDTGKPFKIDCLRYFDQPQRINPYQLEIGYILQGDSYTTVFLTNKNYRHPGSLEEFTMTTLETLTHNQEDESIITGGAIIGEAPVMTSDEMNRCLMKNCVSNKAPDTGAASRPPRL